MARRHIDLLRPTILRRIRLELGESEGRLRSSQMCPAAASEGAVIFRSYFFSARGNSCEREKSKPTQFHGRSGAVNPSAMDRDGASSFGKYPDLSRFKCWPPSWLKTLSGRLRELEVEEVLRRVGFGRRKLYFESIDHHRRMLQNSSRRSQKSGDRASALEAGVKYNVIRIDVGGNLSHLELKASQLGLHPRDVDLLSSSTFIPQRATISVQRDKVLVRMENVRAIVFKDHVLLFDARHPRMSMERLFSSPKVAKEGAQHRARDCFAKALAQKTKELPFDLVDPMPFHLCIMESLLEETSNFFHQKVNRLKLLVERMLHELTHDVSMGGLQKLLPLRRSVTEVEHDVRDAHEAMDQVLRSDDTLQALCLVNEGGKPDSSSDPQRSQDRGPQWSPADGEEHMYKLRQAAADMLFTYQREVDDAGGVLEELRKGMEAAQEVWELGLNTTRNRIIRLNLYFSIVTCFLAVSTLPASFFGMNLVSGFEEHPEVFYWVVGAAVGIPSTMMVGVILAFQLWPKIVDRRRAQDLAGLLDLLRHLDSVDDIVDAVAREVAGKTISEKEFRELLKKHPSAQLMRQKELDLIFRMFDRNRNGFIEGKEQEAMNSSVSASGPPSKRNA